MVLMLSTAWQVQAATYVFGNLNAYYFESLYNGDLPGYISVYGSADGWDGIGTYSRVDTGALPTKIGGSDHLIPNWYLPESNKLVYLSTQNWGDIGKTHGQAVAQLVNSSLTIPTDGAVASFELYLDGTKTAFNLESLATRYSFPTYHHMELAGYREGSKVYSYDLYMDGYAITPVLNWENVDMVAWVNAGGQPITAINQLYTYNITVSTPEASAVPIPGSVGLLASGLLGLGLIGIRRRR